MYVCVHAFKSFAQVTIFISISIKELFIYIYNCLLFQCHCCPHLTCSVPTKCNWCPANSVANIFSDSDVRLLRFHDQNLMYIILCLGCSEESDRIQGSCIFP